ncbi:demethylmenaquinone methyltransferase [Brevibacterium moorei]|uniref:demethylmenaquinone methyltransferase n=1 Tax=Brevibacterium moorei TaxID=2968457 RepID=UPI00211BCA25|nr:demethylmenaquinone methyltransferase [Brevibacterium sp. 68QC2CO]MCQ9385590.1 demethylmenaquinone methyltransferase [Brevibacterium sp. 68QC2CO]
MTRANLDKQKTDVASMFDAVAERYDLTNDAMTFGISRWWRVENTKAVDPQPGEKILDLAAGTGSSSVPYARAGAQVIAGDISEGMLEVGRRRHPEIEFVYADALDLPFDDETFDAVTITYGFRNVQDTATALSEMYRVLKPGGRLIVSEFSTPTFKPFAKFYKGYIMRALPAVAKAVSSSPDAYVYLAESIRAWPAQVPLAHLIRDAGFDRVQYRNLTGGIVALHRGYKPAAPAPETAAPEAPARAEGNPGAASAGVA